MASAIAQQMRTKGSKGLGRSSVVKIRVPLWVLNTIRHLLFRVPKKGDHHFHNHPDDRPSSSYQKPLASGDVAVGCRKVLTSYSLRVSTLVLKRGPYGETISGARCGAVGFDKMRGSCMLASQVLDWLASDANAA